MGRLGVFAVRTGRVEEVEVFRGVETLGWVLEADVDGGVLRGDLKGVLKGERKGFESVWDAASMRRRLAAGVDILIVC